MNERVIILLGALALDVLFGEPPSALHPVVWMGRYIGWGERHAPRARPLGMFLYGAALITLGVVVVVGAAVGITAIVDMLPRVMDLLTDSSTSVPDATFSMLLRVLGLLAGAWLLKTTFAARALTVAAHGVQRALERGDLPEARRRLSWHLVSRDTSTLDEGLVAAAAVESVAENFSDSFVAPLLFFALFGLPGRIRLPFRQHGRRDARLSRRAARIFWKVRSASRRRAEPGARAALGAAAAGGRGADRSGRAQRLAGDVARPCAHAFPQRGLADERDGRRAGGDAGEGWVLPAGRRRGAGCADDCAQPARGRSGGSNWVAAMLLAIWRS